MRMEILSLPTRARSVFTTLARPLQLLGGFDSGQLQRGDNVNFDEAAQLQKEFFLGRVGFREDVMVIEKIEGLRELERAPGDAR